MDDQNRYEEVPQKENVFAKIFKTLGAYFVSVFKDFITSFKYNNMKLAAILVAVPGVFLGFFLHWHAIVVNQVSYNTGQLDANGNAILFGMPFDFTGLVLFILMLFGILNIFGAVTMSGKKNLGSVITCTITSSVIVIAGALYLYALFTFISGYNSGDIQMKTAFTVDTNWIISIVSIIISIVTSIAGVVLGFINYDRTYEKVDR
jgi:hypothetical protein